MSDGLKMQLDFSALAARDLGELQGAMGGVSEGEVVGHALGLLKSLMGVRHRGGKIILLEDGREMLVTFPQRQCMVNSPPSLDPSDT